MSKRSHEAGHGASKGAQHEEFRQKPSRGGAHKSSHGAGKPAGPSQRQLRVAEEIRHVLSGIFARHEFRDPELASAEVTVTEVRIAPDLKRATAFISRLGRTDVHLLIPSLVRATPYLRGQVAHALRLRSAPDLVFQPDTTLDYAMKIEALMHQPEVARDLE